ncbi:endonuclease/exonuclease/phosphatase family protein [Flectobacillus major]|uniref:endonuclease/exonuclease/phosphatase family protein n=1 Tax=Flectobacillus major TaxID=103 RepID=UPI0003FE26E5|nr:endonuclease/exonuclease/phosphatase family protein [Flectobacillus major]
MIKKIASSLLWLSSLPLCMYTLVVYLLGYTIVWEHWIAGFAMMSIPVAQLGCLVVGLVWLYVKPSRALLPLVVLLMGWPFIMRTFHWSSNNETLSNEDLQILSYNVYSFETPDASTKDKAIQYVADFDADIKCFQEFSKVYLQSGKPAVKCVEENLRYHAINADESRHYSGLAIFSKYPIIRKKGKVFAGSNSNGYIYADIVRHDDTIRVINLQLQSMGIRLGKVVKVIKDYDKAKQESKGVLASLKKGFIDHSQEIKYIEKLIDESPYPTIVCGDFNEVPYGLAYGHVRDRLKNAFEEAGNGFGFTLNRSPRWVRIDNQFYSEGIQIKNFKTHNTIKYSDHYPISAVYQVK